MIGLALIAAAQIAAGPAIVERTAPDKVTVRAVRVAAPLTIDGRLDEDVYRSVEAISGFLQQEPREGAAGPVGALRHYTSMRMENRGGAPGGTPELYFTDPDGLLMQLQDTTYCGGWGFLGDVCK